MNGFDWAIQQLTKNGAMVRRSGWNGKGMWLVKHTAYTDSPVNFGIKKDGSLEQYAVEPFIALKTADGKMVPWAPSQTDMLATDWEYTI